MPSGEHREFIANFSSLGSQSLKHRSPNTWFDIPNHLRRRGEPFSRIMPRNWLQWTSSRFPPFGSRLYLYLSSSVMIDDASSISTSHPIRLRNGLRSKSWKHFLLTAHRNISCEIETAFTDARSTSK